MRLTRAITRRLSEEWRKFGIVLGGVLLIEIGARIAAPNLNGRLLSDYFGRGTGNGLVRVYDWFVGGSVSRGAVLALGIMPYVSARIFVRLARMVVPVVEEMSTERSGQKTLTIWTRYLTAGLALVQSYGFARFAQSLPGVVTHPGAGFIAQTMVTLSAGAMFVMWLGERMSERTETDGTVDDEDTDIRQIGGSTIGGRVELATPDISPGAPGHVAVMAKDAVRGQRS